VGATTINLGPIGIGTTPIAAGNLILIIQMDITAKVYHHFSAKFTTDMDLL
jgi:hypothetical protein